MGANLDYRCYKDDTKSNLYEKFSDDRSQSQYEDGHQYSGAIGMLHGKITWKDADLEDRDQAWNYLSDEHRKWDGPMAVSYTNESGEKCWMIGGHCSS